MEAYDQFYLRILTTVASMSAAFSGLSVVFAAILHDRIVSIIGEPPLPEEEDKNPVERERVVVARFGFIRDASATAFAIFALVSLGTIVALVLCGLPIRLIVVQVSIAGLLLGASVWIFAFLTFCFLNLVLLPFVRQVGVNRVEDIVEKTVNKVHEQMKDDYPEKTKE